MEDNSQNTYRIYEALVKNNIIDKNKITEEQLHIIINEVVKHLSKLLEKN